MTFRTLFFSRSELLGRAASLFSFRSLAKKNVYAFFGFHETLVFFFLVSRWAAPRDLTCYAFASKMSPSEKKKILTREVRRMVYTARGYGSIDTSTTMWGDVHRSGAAKDNFRFALLR